MPVAVPLLAAAVGFSAVSSIAGGMSAQSAANQQAKLQEEQGAIALKEANANATNEAFNQNQAIGKQRLAFLANGVSLEGSPSMVLQESKKYGQQQVQSILDAGAANYNLAQKSAAITKNQGRAAMIAGFGQAAGTVASGASSLYSAGAFDTKTPGGYKVTGQGKLPSNTAPYKRPTF